MNHKTFAKKMNTYTVLYVEDDKEVREEIAEFLKRYYQAVYTSHSAEEGFKLYKQYQPHILLLDINLGGMSGVELATLIRQNDKQTRILISTAYTNKEFMLQAIELNLTRYLVKPLTNDDLVKALEKCWNELESENNIDFAEGYSYNKRRAVIVKGKKEIRLRKKEVEILEFFMAHEGEVVRYDMLENGVWKDEFMTRDAIRSQIRNIRKKLELECFENIAGLGYRFTRMGLE
jgi:DNA-binding response OmpR family regulator